MARERATARLHELDELIFIVERCGSDASRVGVSKSVCIFRERKFHKKKSSKKYPQKFSRKFPRKFPKKMTRKMTPKMIEKMTEKLPKKWALFHEKSLYTFICPVESFFHDFGGHFGPRKGVPWGVGACDVKTFVKV